MIRRLIPFFPVVLILLATPGSRQIFAQAAATQPRINTFPTFGISFSPPPDAIFELTDAPSHIGLYRFASTSPNSGAAILIEISPTNGKTLDELSQAIAAQAKAKIDPGAYSIGGEKAAKLLADVNFLTFTHRITYLAAHEDRLYYFSALDNNAASAAKPLEDLIATVKFTPLESPLKHLNEFFDNPIPFFGRFVMNGPASMRWTQTQPASVNLSIFDFSAGKQPANPFSVNIQRMQTIKPGVFADIQDAYSASLSKSLSTSEPLKWCPHATLSGLFISQPVKCQVKLANGQIIVSTNHFCMLDLGQGEFIQIIFSIVAPDPQIPDYISASDKMLDTIQILSRPAANPATRPAVSATRP